jgi:hypothetical protein
LGELSPIGRLLTLGGVLKLTGEAQFLGNTLCFLTKNGWATFWTTFLQTHLVPLTSTQAVSQLLHPGANPTTFEFTATTPAL